MKEVERASEEERKSLQQELTRVKQEVVTIMKVMNFFFKKRAENGIRILFNLALCNRSTVLPIPRLKRLRLTFNNFADVLEILRGNGGQYGKSPQ